jgi:hypothetical protein
VVDSGSACAVLVGLDLGGASTALVTDAVTRASAAPGCAPDNFLISATHTHSSNTQGLGQGPRTARTVADAIVEAAKTAKSKLAVQPPHVPGNWLAPEAGLRGKQYVVIARGGTFLHIVNGQLMAVMIDDDPASSNNQSGQFGIEIEATTKVSVRDLWVKKPS